MAVLTYSTVVNVYEDTNQDFDIAALLQQAGYTANGALTIQSLLVSDGNGGYVPAPTALFSQVDGDTVRVSAAAVPNYFGSFDTLSLVFSTGSDVITLSLKVIIDPVNDAPSGADSTVSLTDGAAYVLKESDFGFSDVDGNNFKSVVFGAQPATGQALYNGVPITPGTEVSVADIRAGLVTFQPAQGATGTVGLSFQVRDDGGLVGTGAADLDPTPNVLSFQLPALASMGDRVWLDSNGNGLQDSSEAGFSGVTVKLLNASGAVVATTTTDAAGNYLFQGLLPGQYKVQVVTPDGYKFTTADAGTNDAIDSDVVWNGTGTNTGTSALVTLAAGENNTSVDAGLKVCLVKVGDTIWWDANGNGVQDTGERGVAGVSIKLTSAGSDGVFGTADDSVRTTTTDANGKYAFDDVAWGKYKLTLDTPDGFAVTKADAGTNDAVDSDFRAVTTTTSVNLITNGSFENLDCGVPVGWCGLGDIIEAGKASTYGVTGATGSTVVELDARYTFSLLGGTGLYQDVKTTAGQSYQLSVDVAARAGTKLSTNTVEVWWNNTRIATIDPTSTTLKTYSFSVTGTGANDRLSFREQCGDDDSVGGIIDNVKLIGTTSSTVYEAGFQVASCDDNLTLDGGLVVTKPATLGNKVWFDQDGNGLQDDCEPGAAGVTVRLLDAAGAVVATTVTDSTGGYLFTGLPPGQYAVQVVAPAGQMFTSANIGSNDGIDSDVVWTGNGNTATSGLVTLAVGETNLTVDAGLKPIVASIGDRVWSDTNGNGLQDAGEGGVAGVSVKLIGAGVDGLFNTADDTSRVTVTDANGKYLFDNVGVGTYKVAIALPSGYLLSAADVGSNDAIDSDFRAVSSYTAGPNLVTNGSFEDVAGCVTGWSTLSGYNVQAATGLTWGVTGVSGDLAVQLDSEYNWGKGSGIYQDVVTEKGQTYQLSVDLASRAGTSIDTNTVEVWWNGSRIASIDPATTKLTTYTFTVTGTGGADRLTFREQAGDDDGVGGIIDNVRLTTMPWAYETAAFQVTSATDNLTIDAGLTPHSVISLVGASAIYEGCSAGYQLTLDHALTVDTKVFVSFTNGTATMETNPGAYVPWNMPSTIINDYSARDANGNYVTQSGGGFYVTIKAGQVTSDTFTIDAWQEYPNSKPNVGLAEAPWETLQIKLSGGNSLTEFAETSKTVSIGDTTTYNTYSPIVLDLDGNGIQTKALIDAGGTFDLLGTGQAVKSGWISGGDGFLAVDANHNGRIDDISELFGSAERGVGFAKLASFDSNGDGVVDANDARFSELSIWQDANGNHQTDAGELHTLAELGIASLNTAYTDLDLNQLGNLLGEASTATRADGSSIDMVDVYFNVYADEAAAAKAALPALDGLLSQDDALLHHAFAGGAPAAAGGCAGCPAPANDATALHADASAELMRQLIANMKNADHSALAAAA
ncbi:carboxypeptidase regulatory-like domain-containing protein [Aquincola tertiaricarbonis]|uniref:Carboxypeptidase regulatory-like domain-containing protein n=1 Tax=Aquincola tertiaricarbonis TaxID=391953 RepID=A0ABY4SAY1_AQUTE|nr:SdrD B-like domain-containing protein [Aquincola tertiaricarbonis]URI09624.1 carboxypeptidase regulatory-like domain-containing protein [Aquincola tertiaricarbonis]